MNLYTKHMGSSKIKFFVGEPEKRTVIQIQREGCRFYRMELDKLLPIGDIFETIRFLYRYNAELAVEKGNRLKPRAFFFNRETAMEALKEGFPVLLSGGDTVISYDSGYNHLTSSDGSVLGDLPAGIYCLAFTQKRLSKTFKEVKAEKLSNNKVREEFMNEKRTGNGETPDLQKDTEHDSHNWKYLVGGGIGAALTLVVGSVIRHFRSAS